MTNPSQVATFDPFEGPQPLAILIQTDPWAMVIGSDTPRVALYENGDIFFEKKVEPRLVYHTVTLETYGLEKVREQLKPVLALKEVKQRYDLLPNTDDLPEAMFYLRDGERELVTSVYGLMATGTKQPTWTEFPGGPKPTGPPDELLDLHRWLCEFDSPMSKEWTPRYVEVMLWDYSYAPDASVRWPKGWPSLLSDRAIKRGDSFSIFLDGPLIPRLTEFLATRKQRGAVEIDGKKMAVSYRLTFPGERTWRRAFADAAQKGENPSRKGHGRSR